MKKRHARRPLLLLAPTNAIPCDFNRLWLRMSARECLDVCTAYGLITSQPVIGDELGQMPAELTAEGALAWMSWHQGRGNYYFGALDPIAPRRISNAAAMTLWLDGQDRATLLDGSDTPVNDGDEVATWADKSGAGHDFTQANSDYRPEWHTDGYVNFEGGISSTMQLDSGLPWSNFISANDSTIFMVVTVNAGSPTNTQILGDGNGNFFLRWTADAQLQLRLGDTGLGSRSVDSIPLQTDMPYILACRRSVTPSIAIAISLNGGEESTTAASGTLASTLSTVNMSIPDGTGRPKAACNIHEILIFNKDIGAADRDAIGRYLQAKWQMPWGINNLQYRSGLFGDDELLPIRAVQVRQALHALYTNDPDGFLFQACGPNESRARELTREVPPAATGSLAPRTPTNILMWQSAGGSSPYDKLKAAYPELVERGNLLPMLPAFFNQNGAGAADYDVEFVVDSVEAALGDLPHGGKCWLVLADYQALWTVPPGVGGNTSGRYALYDRELVDPYRRGLSLEPWWAFQADSANTNFRKFFVDLQAELEARNIALDGAMIDIERWPQLWHLEGALGTLNGPDVLGNETQFRIAVSSVNTGTGVIATAAAHNLSVGNRVAYVSTLTLPTGFSDSTLYWVKTAPTSTTLTISLTSGGAVVVPTGTGSGNQFVLRESLLHGMNDSAWTSAVGNLPAGMRGLLGPELDDSVWRQYQSLTPLVGEVRIAFDTAMYEYCAGYVSRLLASARTIVPGLRTLDYDNHYYASHDYYFGYSHLRGAGEGAGMSAVNLYGDAATGSLARRWNWQLNQVDEEPSGHDVWQEQWAQFSAQLMHLRKVVAAGDGIPFCPWLTTEVNTLNRMGTAGLWSEVALHAVLNADGYVGFYQSATDPSVFPPGYTDQQIADAQKKLIDVVAEADAVLAYASARDPGLAIDQVELSLDMTRDDFDPGTGGPYAPAIAYARVYAGNRWVWRVTPNPTISTTVSQSEMKVRFDNELGYLHVPRGTLHAASRSALAPLGYWVEQPPLCA